MSARRPVRGSRAALALVAPALAAILIFFFLPVGAAFLLSLTDFDLYAIASRANACLTKKNVPSRSITIELNAEAAFRASHQTVSVCQMLFSGRESPSVSVEPSANGKGGAQQHVMTPYAPFSVTGFPAATFVAHASVTDTADTRAHK